MKLTIFFSLFTLIAFSQNTFSIEIGDNVHSQSPWSVIEVDDGYLISSYLNNATNFSVNLDIVLTKIDKEGNLLWETIYEKDTTSEFYPYLKKVNNKNEYILVCSYGQQINDSLNVQFTIVKKINELGGIIWEKFLEGISVVDLDITDNGFIYILTGNYFTESNGYPYGNPVIYKLESDGEVIWKKNYGKNFYELFDFITIIDNNIYIGGSIQDSFDGEGKYYKLDLNGNIIYKNIIQNSVYSIYKDNNELFLLTRNERLYQLLEDGALELINLDFNETRNRIKGFTLTSSKEYVLAYNWVGRIGLEPFGIILLEKYDEKFEKIWSKEYYKGSDHNPRGVIETSDGGLLLFGFTRPETGTFVSSNSISILKMDCEGNLEWSSDACYVPQIFDLTIFPNPFQDILKIQIPNLTETDNYTIALYNKLGQKIIHQKIITKITAINTKTLSDAIYFYTITNNNKIIEQGKVLKN